MNALSPPSPVSVPAPFLLLIICFLPSLSCLARPRILFNFWLLTQSLASHPLTLPFLSGQTRVVRAGLLFPPPFPPRPPPKSYLRFHLNMQQECCTQGLKTHLKRFRGGRKCRCFHSCRSSLPLWCRSGSGVRRRQKPQSKLLWSGADFIEPSRRRGDELCASWRFSENWEVTLCRYKDDLSHTEMCRISADELPVYAPRRARALRRGEKGITDGDVHSFPSFCSCTRVNWEVARTCDACVSIL